MVLHCRWLLHLLNRNIQIFPKFPIFDQTQKLQYGCYDNASTLHLQQINYFPSFHNPYCHHLFQKFAFLHNLIHISKLVPKTTILTVFAEIRRFSVGLVGETIPELPKRSFEAFRPNQVAHLHIAHINHFGEL